MFWSDPYNKDLTVEVSDNVTILFADIAGFTAYSSAFPDKVVNMLKDLFTEFDKNCVIHDVFKLYTIGDCYVVMGFTNANKRVINNLFIIICLNKS